MRGAGLGHAVRQALHVLAGLSKPALCRTELLLRRLLHHFQRGARFDSFGFALFKPRDLLVGAAAIGGQQAALALEPSGLVPGAADLRLE